MSRSLQVIVENVRARRDVIVLVVALGPLMWPVVALILSNGIISVAKVVADVPTSETGQLEIPLEGIELPLDRQPPDVAWRPQTAGISILGVTLLPDGRLEVRGEVQPEQLTDLSALHVEVTLDGETRMSLIDASSRTWKVFFEPSHAPAPGERLNLKAVLMGAQQNAFSVQPGS